MPDPVHARSIRLPEKSLIFPAHLPSLIDLHAANDTADLNHDFPSHRSTVTDPLGNLAGQNIDAQGNRISHTDFAAQGCASAAGVGCPGAASTQTPNGLTTTYTYDSRNRLTRQVTTDSTGTEITRYDYTLGATGRRTQVTDHRGTTTPYTYDANDRLMQAESITYSYDENGNRITKDDGTTQTSYSYDSRNRLIQAVTTMGGVTTKYLIGRNQQYAQVLKELDSANATITDYLYGLDLIKQRQSASDRYYFTDGLGSTKALTDSLGNITDTYDYSAYGELIDQSGATPNDYLFAGEQFDSESGDYYLRARYYDLSIGRFKTMDTWQGSQLEPITQNKYVYGNADPINTIDPSGRFGLIDFGAANNIRGILLSISVPTVTTSVGVSGATGYTLGAIAAVTIGIPLIVMYHEIDLVFNESSDVSEPSSEEAIKQEEYEEAKDFCDNKPDPGRNDCASLSKLIDHAEQCVALYEAWDNKWLKGRHNDKITSWKRRVQNLKDEHRKKCTNK